MIGIGILTMFIGYAIIYWAINAFEGKSQNPFITYIFPWAGAH